MPPTSTATTARRGLPGELLMSIVAILWGSAFPVTRILLEEMPPLGAAAWRTLFAAGGVALLVALRSGPGQLRPAGTRRGRLALLAVLGGATFLIGMNLGVALTGASITSFVTGTYPLLAVVVATVVLREHLPRPALLALVAAAIGLVLLARPGGAHVELIGVAAGLMAALSFAVYMVLARRWADPVHLPALTLAFWLLVSSVVVTGLGQLVVDPAGLVPDLSLSGWAALLWLALPASALPHSLLIVTMRRLPANRAAPFLLLMPISGSLIAAFLLNERLDLLQLVGAGLILAGIGAATLPARR